MHRFAEGDHVTLCGGVPHTHRLDGHSDATSGCTRSPTPSWALSAGDIGSHFPPSDPQWRGADSALFLKHAAELVTARGGRIAHVDVTIICERRRSARTARR
nr:2-C-methyl-D-erythritol 2,4-cyclodiphosphate synthase [Azospirillum sp. TSH58]